MSSSATSKQSPNDSLVGWTSISSIFADVLVSPWNLLIGGLLIQNMSFVNAVASIVIGYAILTLIFIVYGGLGFSQRQQSGVILGKLFGPKIGTYVIPSILALGQVGWASINIKIGGESLAEIVHIPSVTGLLIYAAIVMSIASLGLASVGIIKWAITISSIGLVSLIFFSAVDNSTFETLTHSPHSNHSIFWGVSAVVASFMSFASISPDFFSQVRNKSDVVLSSAIGIFIPGTRFLLPSDANCRYGDFCPLDCSQSR